MKKTNTKFVLTALCFFVLIIAIVYVGLTSPKKTYSLNCSSEEPETIGNYCCKSKSGTTEGAHVNAGSLTYPSDCNTLNGTTYKHCGMGADGTSRTVWLLTTYYYNCRNSSSNINCAPGKYLPANKSSCSSCNQGYYCIGGNYPVSSSDQGIKRCPDGSSSVNGASECNCGSGKTWDAASGQCVDNAPSEDNCSDGKMFDGECYKCTSRTSTAGVELYKWCKKNTPADCRSIYYTDSNCVKQYTDDETPSCSFNKSTISKNVKIGETESFTNVISFVNSSSDDYNILYSGDTRLFTYSGTGDNVIDFNGSSTVGTYTYTLTARHKTKSDVSCSTTVTINVSSSTSDRCDNVSEFDNAVTCQDAGDNKCGNDNWSGCTSKNANGCYTYDCRKMVTCTLKDQSVYVTAGKQGQVTLDFTPATGKTASNYDLKVENGDCSLNSLNVILPSNKAVTTGINPKTCRISATSGNESCVGTVTFNVVDSDDEKKSCCPVPNGTYKDKYYWCDQPNCNCDTSKLTSNDVYTYPGCVNSTTTKQCKFTNANSIEYLVSGAKKTYNISSSSDIASCTSGGKSGIISGKTCSVTVTKANTTSEYVDVNITNKDGTQEHCMITLRLQSGSSDGKCTVSIKGNSAIAKNTVVTESYSAIVARPAGIDPNATILYNWFASGTAFGSITDRDKMTSHLTSKAVSSGTITLKVEISFKNPNGGILSDYGCSTTTSVVVSGSAKYQCWECNDGNNYWVPETTSPSQAAQYAGLGSNYTCNQPRTNLTTKSACVGSGGGSSSGGGYNPPASESQYIPPSPSSEKTPDNPKTGPELIYLVWGIGILMIGYSMWYFKNGVREN